MFEEKKYGFFKRVRKDFVTGLIVILPLFLTVLIIKFLFHRINEAALEPLTRIFSRFLPHAVLFIFIKAIVFIIIFLLLAGIGFAARLILLKNIIASLERIVKRLPLIGSIYFTIKEVSHAVMGREKPFFEKSVLVKFPNERSWSIAFVTKTFEHEGETHYCVFLPTVPNPTTGFMLIVPKKETHETSLTIEETVKAVISAGALEIDFKNILPSRASL